MEAADDISYCLSDIEDGIEKGLFTHDDFVDRVVAEVASDVAVSKVVKKARDKALEYKDQVEVPVFFRSQLITFLVDEVSTVYLERHAEVFSGTVPGLVDVCRPASILLDAIKSAVSDLLYGSRSSIELELAGLAAINGILRSFEPLMELGVDEFNMILAQGKLDRHLDAEAKMFSLLGSKQVAAYRRAINHEDEHVARVRMVVDFVSGMTDIFALRTYQMFSGIR